MHKINALYGSPYISSPNNSMGGGVAAVESVRYCSINHEIVKSDTVRFVVHGV
jgi:hypothetical protein